ncbi:glutathione S-transferase family protein [Pendulispora albinea]|uniref:Glutathione S-transferase family protein n=1 Tax=Pendulispora albinea TaxID=2741071 RepID=A0ABZ2MA25_9BACT
MKLYVSPYSYNARKALVTAFQLGLSPERIVVDLVKLEQRAPAYLALNPSGKVPVLVDGDFVLCESQAIMAYLADATPGQSLHPTELRARAQVNRWMFWSANHWGVAISMINWERAVKKAIGAGEPDAAQIARGEGLFHDFSKVLDAQLAGRTWLAGDTLSLADISVACPLMVAAAAQLPIQPYRNIGAWFERVQSLDAWKRAAG